MFCAISIITFLVFAAIILPPKCVGSVEWYRSLLLWFLVKHRIQRAHRVKLVQNRAPKSHNDLLLYPSPKERELEVRRTLEHGSLDLLDFWGSDGNNNLVTVTMVRNAGGNLDVTLGVIAGKKQLRSVDFTEARCLPRAQHVYEGADIQLTVLEPNRTWRIAFAGFLRDQATNEDVFVRLHFVWRSCSTLVDYPADIGTSQWVKSLEHEPNWFKLAQSSSTSPFDDVNYDQWGMWIGDIRIQNMDELIDLRLWGSRRHTVLTSPRLKNLDRHIFTSASMDDGTFVHVGVVWQNRGLTRLVYGYVIDSACSLHEPSSCVLSHSFFQANDELPRTVNIVFNYRGEEHTVLIEHYCGFHSKGHEMDMKFGFSKVTFDGDMSGRGRTVLLQRSSLDGTGNSSSNPRLRLLSMSGPIPSKAVVKLGDKTCLDSRLVGGKGASLAALRVISGNGEFLVPNGIVITVDAFDMQVASNSYISNALVDLDMIARKKKQGDLESASQRVVELFQTMPLADTVAYFTKQLMTDVYGEDWDSESSFAVRSSALGEDGEESSGAGQNATFLGCKGVSEVLENVMRCWGSNFAYRSVVYRRLHGLPIVARMAVVIQSMVPAKCAGVIFTCDPVTKDPSVVFISANHGVGETVVSGSVDPDTIILVKKNRACRIQRSIIGAKESRLIMTPDGTLESVKNEQENKICLTGEEAEMLGNVAVVVEKEFGSARDIEWALDQDGNIYLLQVSVFKRSSSPQFFGRENVSDKLDVGISGMSVAIFGRVLEEAEEILRIGVRRYGILHWYQRPLRMLYGIWASFTNTSENLRRMDERLDDMSTLNRQFSDARSLYNEISKNALNIEETIASRILKEEEGRTFTGMKPEEALNFLQKDQRSFGILFRSFLKKHGHRCIREFEIRSVPWGKDPTPLIQSLQAMVTYGVQEAAVDKKNDTESIVNGLKTNLTNEEKAVRRQRIHPYLDSRRFPEVCRGKPVPIPDAEDIDFEVTDAVQGTSVCLGRIRAHVRVVASLHEAHLIQQGDILVTYSTDIGWSPFFPLLSGIVTEIGGLISHGAVVAREYGLPCIVGAKNASRIFRSGDLAVLDGGLGTLVKIKEGTASLEKQE
ncbi:unnamed protein product [Cyprideis torosa]|uniref:Uncharacterized protein n=1 Tax=Cyprideis torosa TaxID=163714 RepID=A0A7R8W454_9CRUS|nr:unnamed protein product [Cyprideis torosa]CAG0882792.1 unnamed protein product [Cyprideis torosa]